MKSAMQELIEWTEKYEGKMISADQVVLKAHNLLEKEKEQIEHANAHHRCLHDKTMECTIEAYKKAEKYYNQTYKPETI